MLTAALDAALVCLPPGADGPPAWPAELAFTPVFSETLVHEVNSYHSMLACVASGRYACLLPQSVLSLMTLPENCLSEPLCEATTQLIWRSGLSAPALSEWRKLLQSVAIG